MEHNHYRTKRRWLVPLLLLACFFGGSSPTKAATREFNDCPESNIIAHNPTLNQPYLAFHVMFYDETKSHNGFFLHKSPSGVPALTAARSMSPVEICGMPKRSLMKAA